MLIWVTGFSAAGKTTVANKLHERLSNTLDAPVIHFDGDKLRQAIGGQGGYTRAERIDLSFCYFRLSKILTDQDVTVIVSAVAMYSDVYDWVKDNFDDAYIVYLRVPDEERRRRDLNTKQVYAKIGNIEELYDSPPEADLFLNNFGDNSPDDSVDAIIAMLNEMKS